MPAEADGFVFWMAPLIVVLAAFTTFVVVPFGPTHAITDMNLSLIHIFLLLSRQPQAGQLFPVPRAPEPLLRRRAQEIS